ncbi:putative iron-dependent peroxidase [Trujillonella endophytica]|uniref:Putative iron-dependent peroxidase n=1 Tax=Trujillonella endophytica TaxID=673521 RepID=A0A1H8UV98_9ACTN|nr:putative iron-dependent peroxidase [Trujillella endophytica]
MSSHLAPCAPVTPQTGIFALGTPEHCYLEFDLVPGVAPEELVRAVAGLTEPLSTVGGVNLVVGFRPELWEQVAPGEGPADAAGFDEPIPGPGGFAMPATQHDAWVWVAGGNRSAVFDNARAVIDALRDVADVVGETTGWLYQHSRDLTGFVDGTENPSLLEAPGVVAVPAGPGAGSSVLLFQIWRHETRAWETLGVHGQERAMGRTKADDVEFPDDEKPPSAHIARTNIEVDGEELRIFRRNVAYGGVTDHGTAFVGFAQDRWRMHEMLRRMAGATDGIRDGLTHWTTPLSGAYYTVPAVEALAGFAPDDED